MDIACAVVRIVQCYAHGDWTENRDEYVGTRVVWNRLRECDVPRLMRLITDQHLRDLVAEEWPPLANEGLIR